MRFLDKSAASFLTVLKGEHTLCMTILSRQVNIPEKPELESQEQHWGVLTEAVGCISAKKTLVT